jgi:hypothetical protein
VCRFRADSPAGLSARAPAPYRGSVVLRRLLVAAALAAVVLLAFALTRQRETPRAPVVASPTLTPGALNPEVTQATIGRTICVHGWTRTIRPPSEYTTHLKLDQLRQLGLSGGPADYQEDHLISLELGGHPTDPRNLWPEPYPRAAEVDGVENELNAAVCSGRLALAEAQRRESRLKHTEG